MEPRRGRQDERRSNLVCYIQKRLLCFYTEVSHEGRPRGHRPSRVRVRLPFHLSLFPALQSPLYSPSFLSLVPLSSKASKASLRGSPSLVASLSFPRSLLFRQEMAKKEKRRGRRKKERREKRLVNSEEGREGEGEEGGGEGTGYAQLVYARTHGSRINTRGLH